MNVPNIPTRVATPHGKNWLIARWTVSVKAMLAEWSRTPFAQSHRVSVTEIDNAPGIFLVSGLHKLVIVEVGAEGHYGEFEVQFFVNGDDVKLADLDKALRRRFDGVVEDPLE